MLALATLVQSSPLFYQHQYSAAIGNTVVRSQRLGGNFAYSINSGVYGVPAAMSPLVLPQVTQAKPIAIKAVPSYGYSFGYPLAPFYPTAGYPYAPLGFNYPAPAAAADSAIKAQGTDNGNDAMVVEAAF